MRCGPDEAGSYCYDGAGPKRAGDNWHDSRDLGDLDADGFLCLADRKSNMILVGGSNVYPAEVEGAREERPDVEAACAVGLPGEYGNRIRRCPTSPPR